MVKEKKEVVKKLIEALPKMSTYELGYLLGRVEEKEDAGCINQNGFHGALHPVDQEPFLQQANGINAMAEGFY